MNKTIWIVVAIIVVAGIAWYVWGSPSSATYPSTSTTQPVTTTSNTTTTTTVNGGSVSYTNAGFSPATIAIADGQTVTWTNNSSENLWVASDPHPLHNGYDGTTLSQHCAAGYTGAAPFDSCTMIAPGGTWSFTFDKVGTWGYHNHADESMQGTVVVAAPAPAASTGVNVNVQ